MIKILFLKRASPWSILGLLLLLVMMAGCRSSAASPANGRSAGAGPVAAPTIANEASSQLAPATSSPAAIQEATTEQVPTASAAAETPARQEATPPPVDATIRTARTLAAAAIYAEPNTSATVLGELKPATLVVITESAGGWYKIMYVAGDNRYGWLPQAAVNLAIWSDSTLEQKLALASSDQTTAAQAVSTTTATATNQEAQTGGITLQGSVLASSLNVRSAPSANQTILGQLSRGERVEIVERRHGWLQIRYPAHSEKTAWVSDDYVAVDGEPAPIAPVIKTATSSAPKTSSSGLAGTLVFQESSGGAIYIYSLKNQSLRLLTGGFDPALSPDGSVVAFTRQGGEQGLYLIDSDGSNERLIFSGSDSPRAPSWSLDGRFILFSRVTGYSYCRQVGPRCVPDRTGLEAFPLKAIPQYGLSRVDRNGNDFRDIPALNSAEAPDWNEAGIVYQSSSGIQATADLPAATSRLVVSGYNYQDPDWQPGGGRIVFQSKQGNHWEIFAVNPDGSGLIALTKPASTLVDEFPQNVSPAWSPDGRAIVFLSNRADDGLTGAWRLWVMDADGDNQRLLDANVLGQIAFRYDFHADNMVDWR